MRKRLILSLIMLFSITACDGWEYQIPTFPAPPPTITPSIHTPTPAFVTATNTMVPDPVTPTATDFVTLTAVLNTEIPTITTTAFTEAPSPTNTATLLPVLPNIIVEVLGCNTSIDITHGMGEVTNAYVILKNSTGTDMTDVCTTLVALDEGRVHPDKTVCVPELKHGLQVTLKLTVDSTYKADTPVQVEVKSSGNLLSRIGQESCTDIGLFGPSPASLLTPVAIE